MILVVVLGLLIGLALGSLGGGGSILAVPVLAHLAGQSAPTATATALVAVGVSAAVGSVGHARRGNVRWGSAAAFVVTGVAGSWAGTRLNGQLDGDALLLAFSGLVLVAAHRMLFACPSCTNVGEERAVASSGSGVGRVGALPSWARPEVLERDRDPLRSAVKVLAAGSVVGLLTGLFGVGGGFVIVPALTLALGLNMPKAIGTSLVVIVGNAAVALAFRGLDAVDWDVAVGFSATMLVGTLVGSLVAARLRVDRSLNAFAGVLVAVALANAVAAGRALWG